MIHYLPSCKIKALHKEESVKLQHYLAEKGVNILGCCRIPQSHVQMLPGDTVLTNCTSCAIITDEHSPEVNEISLYEYLLEDDTFPWPDFNGERITVQDCYRSTHKPEVQKAIRECLLRMNMVPVEIEENYEKARFDGTFVYEPVSESNLKLAPNYFTDFQNNMVKVIPADQQKQAMEDWVKQYETERVVCYCNSCLKGLKLGGANAVHIVDLIAEGLQYD